MHKSFMANVLQPHVECCICMGTLYNAVSCTPCLHSFCMGCICRCFDPINGKCPMCRGSVKEISPNLVLRDLVKTYLELRPDQIKPEKDQEEADQAELEYSLKWLASTDCRLLEIESLASLQGSPDRGDSKYSSMFNRVTNLFYKQLIRKQSSANEKQIPIETVAERLKNLLVEVKKEALPASIFLKYHRLEQAYKKLVRISVPAIGPAEHTWIGNMFFEKDYADLQGARLTPSDESFEMSEGEPYDLKLAERIADLTFELRNPDLPPRRPARPLVGGFDPVDLEALARVQNMRYPGFRRAHELTVYPSQRTEIVPQPMQTRRRARLEATTMAPPDTPAALNTPPPRSARLVPAHSFRQAPPRRRSSRIAARNQAV